MQRHWLGTGLAALFAFSVALRDVYFAGVFQGLSFFSLVTLAFGLTVLVFVPLGLVQQATRATASPSVARANPGRLWPSLIGVNVFTAAAWLSYFFALKNLEPAPVNILFSGVGPLVLGALGALGWTGLPKVISRGWQVVGQWGVLATLAATVLVYGLGLSGFQPDSLALTLLSAALALGSGVSITFASLFSKKLNDAGLLPSLVLGARFVLLVTVALVWSTVSGTRDLLELPPSSLGWLTLSAFGLIVVPTYLFQLALSLTSVSAATLISAASPVLIFALQRLEGRVEFSPYTLAIITAYAAFILLGHWRRP